MSEPDHIIVKPIPNLAKDGLGAAFPFFYIEPKKYEKVLRKYYPEERGPVTNIDPIGNSPVIVGKVCFCCVERTIWDQFFFKGCLSLKIFDVMVF